MFDDKGFSKEVKNKAHHIVAGILQKRGIKPDKCAICGNQGKIEAHHPDYSKIYQVIFVCWSCHRKIHHSNKTIQINKKDIIDLKYYSNKSTKGRSKYIFNSYRNKKQKTK